MKSKTYTQSKRPLDKNQSSKFCQSGVKQTHFQNLKEKRKCFFFIIGALETDDGISMPKHVFQKSCLFPTVDIFNLVALRYLSILVRTFSSSTGSLQISVAYKTRSCQDTRCKDISFKSLNYVVYNDTNFNTVQCTKPSLIILKDACIFNMRALQIDRFTVVCLISWPLNESEAGVDFVSIETSLLFLCKFLLISMRTTSLT